MCLDQQALHEMPVVKIWNRDFTIKKMGNVTTLHAIKTVALEKGICVSEKARVFLQDWTEVDDEIFTELLGELPVDQRIFIVCEDGPQVMPSNTEADGPQVMPSNTAAGTSGLQDSLLNEAAPSPELTASFKLRLDSLSKAAVNALEAGRPLASRDRLELVRVVVNDMLKLTCRPQRELITSVAKEIVERFPASLEDHGIDGKVMGRGFDSLFQQLESRVENVNRGMKAALLEAGDFPVPKRRNARFSYGCVNWQPNSSEGNGEEIKKTKEWMKQEALKSPREVDLTLAREAMDSTYAALRTVINSREPLCSTQQLKEEWPLLFHKPLYHQHIDKLLGKDFKKCFDEGVTSCTNTLMDHLTAKPSREIMHWMARGQVAEERGDARAKEKVFVPILASYFKEETRSLFHIFEEGCVLADKIDELPPTPVVVAIGGVFKDDCFLVTEHQTMFDEPMPFLEALCLQFGTFYVLNLAYPKEASATLEFIQRQIVQINPDRGSKRTGSAKRTTVHPKILKLLKSFK
ncbi:uncharacterized protein LOC120840351 isoform X4 [Ixodes scapularis]|uniref:uncharacterized protein LOC120840351 isoform X4 n=1 Tax=Ixodes scapularis TaxID=6945 RepID=UPI001A9CD121|nr:uncharacterized protein LOC120840351 isoform X4 [Ixodes scapularis]